MDPMAEVEAKLDSIFHDQVKRNLAWGDVSEDRAVEIADAYVRNTEACYVELAGWRNPRARAA